jgi:hypothetical protein
MTRECHVRICGSLGGKFAGATRRPAGLHDGGGAHLVHLGVEAGHVLRHQPVVEAQPGLPRLGQADGAMWLPGGLLFR